MEQFNLQQLISLQPILVNQVCNIIESFPTPGIYKNEICEQDWNQFINGFKQIIIKKNGERGEVAQKIQGVLINQASIIDELFMQLNIQLTAQAHIKQISQFFETFSPCEMYDNYLKAFKIYVDSQKQYLELSQCNIKRALIIDQLTKKYSIEQSNHKYQEIIKLSEEKVEINKQKLEIIQDLLKSNKRFQLYKELKEILQIAIEEWERIDCQVGKDNTLRGGQFEVICSTHGIEVVLHKLSIKREHCIIKQSLKWTDNKGEIDFTIFDLEQNIIAFVECKSRIFDVAEGYRQSGEWGRKIKGKQQIICEGMIMKVRENVPCFVITNIPPRQYHLGFESELKGELNKITKNLFFVEQIVQYDFQKEFKKLSQKFGNYISPINWIKQHHEFLIIIPFIN